MSVIIYMNDIKHKRKGNWLWTLNRKVKGRVTKKGCSWRDLIKVYKSVKYNVCDRLDEWKQT